MARIGKGITHRAGRELAEMVLGKALGLLGSNPDRNVKYVISAIDHIAKGEKQKVFKDWINNWLSEGRPGREFLGRMLKNTHPSVRRRYIARMIVSMFFRDQEMRDRCLQKYGILPPHVMLISPTMRCNFRCQGCFAASYERKDDMKPEVFDRVLGEAEDIGINFFIILGGEPFLYPELFDILSKHGRSFYQIYTNASFIDQAMARKLAQLGNIAPQISVNGPDEYTERTRGKGAFQQVMQAMDNLREAGCVFGFSSLVSRDNADIICSEEWVDLLIEKGALYGWLFLYMPVGGDPDPNLMPTPEQRNKLRIAVRRYRQTKPILPIDFWNDGALTGGCIAGGRMYFHINHRGDVEPCIFCHFATHNINQCSLAEALASPFFASIRESQPFSYNTLRPCPMIDHPGVMWQMIKQHGARPTHDGAEKIFTVLDTDIQRYAAGVQQVIDQAWDNDDYHEWVPPYTKLFYKSPEKLEALRKAYHTSRTGHQNNLGTPEPCLPGIHKRIS
ncbi:MAG: radical SAM protein [Chloroflexota bacterium]